MQIAIYNAHTLHAGGEVPPHVIERRGSIVSDDWTVFEGEPAELIRAARARLIDHLSWSPRLQREHRWTAKAARTIIRSLQAAGLAK